MNTAEQLADICLALGLPARDEQLRSLADYLVLLQRWNATYNLTAVRDPAAMLSQHLADCLAVVGPLTARVPRGRVLDVGSGGGLPGVVLAVMQPDLDVTCVDAVGKKAAFVRQVAGALKLPNLHAAHKRVESLRAGEFDVVTARAFSSLVDLVQLTQAHLAPGGCWMAMKGKAPQQEMDALPSGVQVFHVEQVIVPGLGAERCLVWMRLAQASSTDRAVSS